MEKRKHAQLTQQELSDALELARPSIVNIEKGKQALSIHHLIKLCAFLNCNPTDIIPPIPKFKVSKTVIKKVVEVEKLKYKWD